MADIRLVYDPLADQMHIYYEEEELTAAENRVCDFLRTYGFRKCLLPFWTKYAVWEGLPIELAGEVNDRTLCVVFEGRQDDYELVRHAFEKHAGSTHWQLTYTERFEAVNAAQKLSGIVQSLREVCESRAELAQADSLLTQIKTGQLADACAGLKRLLDMHKKKWDRSTDAYRQEKLVYLSVLENECREAERMLEVSIRPCAPLQSTNKESSEKESLK